jgi:hypothetical protein
MGAIAVHTEHLQSQCLPSVSGQIPMAMAIGKVLVAVKRVVTHSARKLNAKMERAL